LKQLFWSFFENYKQNPKNVEHNRLNRIKHLLLYPKRGKCMQFALFLWKEKKHTSLIVFFFIVESLKLFGFILEALYSFNWKYPEQHHRTQIEIM
jgi:hypothetical protein